MAATQFSRSPSINGTRTPGILLETMKLVAPKKELTVPNHLLDSKIYSKVAQNSVVQARPAVLHFGGFEIGKKHTLKLHLGNVSTEVQRMHIIPPQSKYFDIKYSKGERLVPGLALECSIEFSPDEWRYYYDCIRIHTKGEENLIIPVHAYPVMNTADWPDNIDFPPVPVGHMKTRVIPLQCHAPIDFEFQLAFVQPHPAFTVSPMSGVVPANDVVNIVVTFTPTEFHTAHMKLQLLISQFNSKPLVCTFTGVSTPGLARELKEKKLEQVKPAWEERDSRVLDPTCISPIDRARQKRKTKKKSKTGLNAHKKANDVEIGGVRITNNLDTPWAVGQVLNQDSRKISAKDFRQAVLAKKESDAPSTRQMKEALFEQSVRQNVYEERQNQLRWQSKLGENQMHQKARLKALDQREDSWRAYKRQRGDPCTEDELERTCSQCTFRRTMRDSNTTAEEGMKFDTYTNDMWALRHSALSKFAQAARTVLIRRRAQKKVEALRDMVLNWGKSTETVLQADEKKIEDDKEIQQDVNLTVKFHLTPDKVKSVTFPTYAPPNVKDDMAPDALGVVPFKPTEIEVKRKVPFFNLKVPQQYRLMNYSKHDIHQASQGFVPPKQVRPLRTGAQDEMINIPVKDIIEPASRESEDIPVDEGDLKVEEIAEGRESAASKVVTLTPPEAMFQPMDYPPMHIFNPTPGLQVFQAPLPYAEVDPDFHLCPLPRYTSTDVNNPHMSTQKRYLDREDVIKGVMSWKKFPSQGLTSLANTPTLTNVWVPRWNDPFGSDLLPHDVPPLFDGLPEGDKENIMDVDDDDEEEDGAIGGAVALTPEMVNAQFHMIQQDAPEPEVKTSSDLFPYGNKMPPTNIPVSSTGPVPREKREQELDSFLNKKYNRLGQKIEARVDYMNGLKSNPDLILK